MKLTIKKMAAVIVFLAAFMHKTNAQVEVMANYIFSQDSVAGFDEQAASAGALSQNFFGREFKVFMYRAKRTYIIQKYGLKQQKPVTLFQNPSALRPAAVNAGACNNEDFELATGSGNILAPNPVQGWTLQSGSNSNSCNPPTLNAVNYYTVFTAPISDDRIPGTISSYFDAGVNSTPAGQSFIRLNDASRGAKAVRMSKSFIPTPNSALFQYAYIAVIEDGSHGCCDQAGFNIKMTVTNTITNTPTLLACPNISVAVPGALCSFTIPPGGPVFSPCIGANGNGWSYANWTTSALDLTQYIGSMVQIDVTVVDCNAGGHGAYFYFDAKCSPMVVTGNDLSFAAGTQSVLVPTCGAAGATICATPGLGPYSWAGPNVPPGYAVPSMTNQCYTSSISATYTLYMEPPGSCAPIGRVVQSTITPAPLLLASILQASCGGTAAVITLTPSGSASVPSSISWFPTPLALNSATTVATYTAPTPPTINVVTVTATDPLGCLITRTLSIIPPAPYPTFSVINLTSGTPTITCTNPTIVLNATTNYTYGTLSYLWSNNSMTSTATQFSVTAATGVTVIATDPATNCQASKTLAIGINTTAPTTAITPSTQNITCGAPAPITVSATASPSVNVHHEIWSPYGGTATAASHTMIYIPSCGVYTHVTINDINGCLTQKLFTVFCAQGFPNFNVQSPQSFTVGCSSTSCAVINIVNGNTDPPGGPVSYTVLSSSSNPLNPVGSLSTQSTYTLCTAAMYTVVTRDNTTFCETRIPISILQNTVSPNLQASYERDVLDCNHPKVTLHGLSTNPNAQYQWGFTGTPGFVQNDSIVAETDPGSPTNPVVDNFTLTITDGVNACKSTTVIPIRQNLYPPNAVISNGGITSISCKTPTIVLTNQSSSSIPSGTFPNNLPVVSSWGGPTPQQPLENVTTYTAQTPGTYTATLKDLNNGCTAVATMSIGDTRVYPDLTQTPTTAIVLDCGALTVPVSPFVSNPLSSYSYSWTAPPTVTVSGALTKTLIVNQPGEYAVLVTNTINGCQSYRLLEVVNGALTAGFVPDQTNGVAPLTVNFTNSSSSTNGNSNINSIWNFGNSLSATYSTVQTANTTFFQPGTYTVTLYATKGSCLDTAQAVITVEVPSQLEIPNVFTPNGDGVNDFFFLKATNLTTIKAKIVDRWGHIVFENTSATGNILWDGKNQYGKEAAAGTYFYMITATGADGHEYNSKGTVSIFR